MKSSTHRFWRLLSAVSAILLLGGCGDQNRRYGVVLWSQSRTFPPTGSVVTAGEISEVSGRIPISPLGEEQQLFIDPGFVKVFQTLKKAQDFSQRYQAYQDAFATAEVRALRIRSEPSTDGDDLYRLRRDERVKLVGRAGVKQTINGRTGYWQEVITQSGVRGYTFGPLLSMPTDLKYRQATVERSPQGDWRDRLYSHTWRPGYMREMVSLERIDLRKLDPNIGLFTEKESHALVIDTGKSRVKYDASNPVRIGERDLSFDDGALRIRFLEDGDLFVRYEHNGNTVQERYVLLQIEVESLIERERQRRTRMYQAILGNGDRYRSTAYGTLEFQKEDQRVTWTGRQLLVPDVIPETASTGAAVRFDVFVEDSLSVKYDGAMSLLFEMGTRQHELNVLYELLPTGLRWTLVSEESARDSLIQEAPRSSLVMFFSKMATNEPTSIP